MRAVGQRESTVEEFVAAVTEMCEFSGGGVVEPEVRDHGVRDHEDNLIASLAKDAAVDALVIVTSDHDLLDVGPGWYGRLIVRPHEFVRRVVAR